MIYIIDANNLAGKLGILGEDDFDKMLVGLVEEFFVHRDNKVFFSL